jgi:hemerythrin-like domain-containing protein
MIENQSIYHRRDVVAGAGAASAALILGSTVWAAEADRNQARPGTETGKSMIEIEKNALTPMEDLTCQHAVARRVLLVYQTGAAATAGSSQPPLQALATAAAMMRSMVDDHHVQLEENYLFPLFQKAGQWADLVSTLREQHAAARRLTDSILQATQGAAGGTAPEGLARNLMAYVRMIQAHTAYEETLLYPQIRVVASEADYDRFQRTLQEADRKKLGPEGVAGLLDKVAALEKSVGITSLAQFTPKAGEPVAKEIARP